MVISNIHELGNKKCLNMENNSNDIENDTQIESL